MEAGLELVRLAREPTSSRPSSWASCKNAPRILLVCRSLLALEGKKQTTVVRNHRFPPSEPPRPAPLIRALKGSRLLLRFVDDRAALRPRRKWCLLVRRKSVPWCACAYCGALLSGFSRRHHLPLACHTSCRRASYWRLEKAHWVDSIFNQANRRRVSTDRLNRADSQLVSSLESESGPTPAGKTLPTLIPQNRVSEGKGTIKLFFSRPCCCCCSSYPKKPA